MRHSFIPRFGKLFLGTCGLFFLFGGKNAFATEDIYKEVGYYDTYYANWVAVANNYVFIADDEDGLRIIDISNPESLTEVGHCSTQWAYGVAVADSYAFVADGEAGLKIIDVTDPENPFELNCFSILCYSVTVTNNYAFAAEGDPGVRIIDVSNPGHPSEVGYYNTPGYARAVAVADNFALVADGEAGLRIIDISNPQNPSEVGYYDKPGDARAVAVADNFALVADGKSGLRIVRLSTTISSTPQLEMSVAFVEPDTTKQDSALEAGEEALIVVWVTNKGKGKVGDLQVKAEPLSSILGIELGPEQTIPSLLPNAQDSTCLQLKSTEELKDQKGQIRVWVTEPASGYNLYSDVNINLKSKPEAKPTKQRVSLTPAKTDSLLINIPKGKKNPNGIGVIICVSEYKNLKGVKYAKNDERAMKGYLINAFGYKEDNIIERIDPTLAELNNIFGSTGDTSYLLCKLTKLKPDSSDLFIYYVGHGGQDADGAVYLLPADVNYSSLKSTGYPLGLLYDNLSKIPAKSVTVVIDACFSGQTPSDDGKVGPLPEGASQVVIKEIKDESPGNMTVITAGTGSQVASWYPEKEHSLFTYFLLKGFKGEADFNKDRKITLGELEKYLKENVPSKAMSLHGRVQTPKCIGDTNTVILRR